MSNKVQVNKIRSKDFILWETWPEIEKQTEMLIL